ncbi:MAG: Stp1/IreP family PP2C-type Ser/Thr phosphatase [Burkholderiales bacterium]|jgi:serine/threonine protein phosphatase PrpC|nr:Stp1/IreP family PP2C-type Ser/Thr phosphatase [Burkholderiales bacterium]MCX7206332.1 Stp1/IreP family PP2C-type Ser/Thr phosphatase [Pseudomonadota bacterium]
MLNLSQALEMAGLTDTGLHRDHNEDTIHFDAEKGLVVLADGMGGYNAGEVASGIAVEMVCHVVHDAMQSNFPLHLQRPGSLWPAAHDVLMAAVHYANQSIYGTAQSQPQCAGMGTTLVCALFYDSRLAVAHVGDSRLYRLRNNELMQLTRDHSFLQEQIDSGLITPEEAKHSTYKNLVTRAVGIDSGVQAELHEHAVLPGDIYLFCSDGLSDMADDADIADTIMAFNSNLALNSEQLIQLANDLGGKDNISAILVKVKEDFPASIGLWSKMSTWFT